MVDGLLIGWVCEELNQPYRCKLLWRLSSWRFITICWRCHKSRWLRWKQGGFNFLQKYAILCSVLTAIAVDGKNWFTLLCYLQIKSHSSKCV